MKIGEPIVFDDPDNFCFGCSPHNDAGLKLEFVRASETAAESRYTCPPHLVGPPGVVHGGVQAALLDEVMGAAAHLAFDDERVSVVTADFRLRYRRPVPAGQELRIRGEVVRREDRDIFVEGSICDAAGEVLTRGEARWRQIET